MDEVHRSPSQWRARTDVPTDSLYSETFSDHPLGTNGDSLDVNDGISELPRHFRIPSRIEMCRRTGKTKTLLRPSGCGVGFPARIAMAASGRGRLVDMQSSRIFLIG